MENVYSKLTHIVADLLIQNIGSTMTDNNKLDELTNANETLTNNWANGMPDPNSPMGQAFAHLQQDIKNSTKPGDCSAEMAKFIQTYLSPSNQNGIYQMSQAFGVALMSLLNSQAAWDKTAGPNQMSVINQYISLISSTSQQGEQIGQNQIKTQSGVIQNDQSAQQTLADIGTTANEVLAALVQAFNNIHA